MSLSTLTVTDVIGVILLSTLSAVQATITLTPSAKQLSYVEGDTAILTCYTTLTYAVLWQYSKDFDSAPKSIFRRGLVINGFRARTTTDLSIPNTYTIHIRNLQPSDSGVYGCLEDDGLGPDKQFIEVIVITKEEQTTSADTRQKHEATTDQPSSVTASRPTTEIVPQPIEQTTLIVVISTAVAVAVVAVVVAAAVVVVCVIAVRRRRKRADNNEDVEKHVDKPIYKGPADAVTAVKDEELVEENGANSRSSERALLA